MYTLQLHLPSGTLMQVDSSFFSRALRSEGKKNCFKKSAYIPIANNRQKLPADNQSIDQKMDPPFVFLSAMYLCWYCEASTLYLVSYVYFIVLYTFILWTLWLERKLTRRAKNEGKKCIKKLDKISYKLFAFL